MRRILHYVGKMDIGGMESIIMSLYRTIDREEWQFDFAVHTEEKAFYDDEIINLGGRIFRFPKMRENPLAYKKAWDMFWKAHKNEFDVFQMHTNSLANCIALRSAYRARIPKRIVHAHSSYANKGKLQNANNFLHYLHRNQLKYLCTDCIACSKEAANWMFGKKNYRTVILNNGIDYKAFKYEESLRNSFRKEINVTNELVICQIGNMLPVKNHKFSIALAERLCDLGVKYKMVFAGSGPLYNELLSLTKEKSLSNSIVYLGRRTDVNRILSGSDIFLLPSLYEGMPLSAIEAQVSGIHCIISDTITREIVITERCTFLPINKIEEWIDFIMRLDFSFGRINCEIDNKFDIQNVTREYTKIISR